MGLSADAEFKTARQHVEKLHTSVRMHSGLFRVNQIELGRKMSSAGGWEPGSPDFQKKRDRDAAATGGVCGRFRTFPIP